MRTKRLKATSLPFLAAAMLSLLAGIWAAMLRLGLDLPVLRPTLAEAHGALMVSGFLGTLICLERAVALGAGWAYVAPGLTASGALLLVAGVGGVAGPILVVAGSLALLVDFAAILRRQAEIFTATMALGAAAWLVGNALWLFGCAIPAVVPWWIAFLVLTIMGERLELSRMRGPSAHDKGAFILPLAVFCVGLIAWPAARRIGFVMMGAGLIGLAAWIAIYDIARRTIHFRGLPRFGAVNLLAAAFWLSVGGLIWLLSSGGFNGPAYDAVLHSVFLGFVFSMIFAHAPIIFPAVLGKALPFKRIFYAHVVLLHLSLALRVGGDLAGCQWAWQWGGVLNAVALVTFLANTVGGIGPARGAGAAELAAASTVGEAHASACADS